MSLEEMLCQVQGFSPTGLQGLRLPSRDNSSTRGRPLACQPLPPPAIFKYQQLLFKPVKIPVVFHCKSCHYTGTNKLVVLVFCKVVKVTCQVF